MGFSFPILAIFAILGNESGVSFPILPNFGILGNESGVSFPILLNLRLLGNENGFLFPIFLIFGILENEAEVKNKDFRLFFSQKPAKFVVFAKKRCFKEKFTIYYILF